MGKQKGKNKKVRKGIPSFSSDNTKGTIQNTPPTTKAVVGENKTSVVELPKIPKVVTLPHPEKKETLQIVQLPTIPKPVVVEAVTPPPVKVEEKQEDQEEYLKGYVLGRAFNNMLKILHLRGPKAIIYIGEYKRSINEFSEVKFKGTRLKNGTFLATEIQFVKEDSDYRKFLYKSKFEAVLSVDSAECKVVPAYKYFADPSCVDKNLYELYLTLVEDGRLIFKMKS